MALPEVGPRRAQVPVLPAVSLQFGVSSYAETTTSSERSEEHTSELQSQSNIVCRLLLEKKKRVNQRYETGYSWNAAGLQEIRRTTLDTTVSDRVVMDERVSRYDGMEQHVEEEWRGVDGKPVRSKVEYDVFGRVVRQYAPVGTVEANLLTAAYDWFTYDALDRPLAFFFLVSRPMLRSTLFPYTTLFR